MKKFLLIAFPLLMLFTTTGCSTTTAQITMLPNGKVDVEYHDVGKGKLHVLPTILGGLNKEYGEGLTSLDTAWDQRTGQPRYATKADLKQIFSERAKSAFEQAGYTITYGETVPEGTDLVVHQIVLGATQNPFQFNTGAVIATAIMTGTNIGGSTPVAEVVVNATFMRPGASQKGYVLSGRGASYLHLTKQGGLDTSFEKALTDYQQNLIKASQMYLQESSNNNTNKPQQ